ncbi:ribbon-helix-helix DNA binding domain protein [Microbacterium phage Fransoyer]|nr:ribbon-helix-helix DNA binding domain protein [Microbacterium phage RubyRalph]QUE25568.1 ribbon-helix-helix DNA binding domain protein [Microbacterium phage SadLad]UUG69585.1 ribbon-helix-helix DNA binding domain protein [Microbacterium phage Fransoyer]
MAAGWRELVRDQLNVKAEERAARQRDHGRPISVSRVGFAAAVQPLLVRAAQLRGISIAGYIRRATMAFVARDLGLDPIEIFEQDMAPSPYGRGGQYRDKDLDGKLFGQWKVGTDGSAGSES